MLEREGIAVYILSSISGVLYIGVTNNLQRRINEYTFGEGSVFTSKYKCTKLVYFESYKNMDYAIKREKQLKKWSRMKKMTLIKHLNPTLIDLSRI